MDTTDGLQRGLAVKQPADQCSCGPPCTGSIMDVVGDPVDALGPIFPEGEEVVERPVAPQSSMSKNIC